MKFKLLAIAAVMAVSGAANATHIDNGQAGNGGLFFSIWDDLNSYTRNLTDATNPNMTIDGFGAVVGTGLVDLTWTADTLFTSFLSTADLASLKWNVVATDRLGPVRVLETFTAPKPLLGQNANIIRTLAASTVTQVNSLNLSLVSANSATFAIGDPAYAGRPGFSTTAGGGLNFSNGGTLANSDYATGLNFMRISAPATTIVKSIYTTYATAAGNDVKIYLDSANALHIAAVPEPETYAMLMAGLGLMGAIARRRNKKSA